MLPHLCDGTLSFICFCILSNIVKHHHTHNWVKNCDIVNWFLVIYYSFMAWFYTTHIPYPTLFFQFHNFSSIKEVTKIELQIFITTGKGGMAFLWQAALAERQEIEKRIKGSFLSLHLVALHFKLNSICWL